METIISEVEYIIPVPDRPVGSLSFKVSLPVVFKEGQKFLSESDAKEFGISEETMAIIEQLKKSLINDLEK